MRVTVLTVGSRGDVQPYLALALGLRRAGHDPVLATHEAFRPLIGRYGIPFSPIHGDPRAVLLSDAGQALLETGENPIGFARRFTALLATHWNEFARDAAIACRDAGTIVYSPLAFAGYHLAQAAGVPSLLAGLQPLAPTRSFPLLGIGSRVRLGGTLNRWSHLLGRQLFWQPLRAQVNRWRRDELGLPPIPLRGPYATLEREREPHLYGFSERVVPRPRDWPWWHRITGYWFLDPPPAFHPPSELEAFLRAGPPPLYAGFGSMADRSAARLAELLLGAARATGHRLVVGAGWGGIRPGDASDDLFVTGDVPHSWLFPRVAAVVHHGGAGTTAAGLRAGVPAVVAPYFGDQPFWGRRLHRLGVAPAPIPVRRLTSDRLVAAIGTATASETVRQAGRMGAAIRRERGVAVAVDLIGLAARGG